jgi:hypothetical protein
MIDTLAWRPTRWAAELTKLLDASRPSDRFQFDIAQLTRDVSRHYGAGDPIVSIEEADITDCEGVLYPSEDRTSWGILTRRGTHRARRRFTIAHELGHWLMHRRLMKAGHRSSEAAIQGRSKLIVEREANEFASNLLMPFNDFREQIPANEKTSIARLSGCAERYGVSFTASTLQWLRYTERAAVFIVTRDGYVLWCWASAAAYSAGLVVSSRNGPVGVPATCAVAQTLFDDQAKLGLVRRGEGWFERPHLEMAVRSEHFEREFTVIQFE